MLFNTLEFFIFFCIVTAAYWALPHRWRWPLLVVASCYFYMVLVPAYILILFFLILVDYVAGILISASEGSRRKALLVMSLVANIGTLVVFKYYNFIDDNLLAASKLFGGHIAFSALHLVLPIGLSFHTFQSMSYTIEVYRGRYPAEHHLGRYALYVLFYPQMVAGPIERPGHLLRQFHEEKTFAYEDVADGLKLMVWGLFKKVVIADRLAILVNQVYDHPSEYTGFPLILATYFFSFQIYCDFSGYSDMAIGAAKVMGIDLARNFERPYYAKSIGEFWRRWHISLSSWFRDYLYIPLGGNRVTVPRWYFNLFFVFLVSGLWHGANWTFVVWGGLHGLYMIASTMTQTFRKRLTEKFAGPRMKILQKLGAVFLTFHLVTFSWIFFRAKSVEAAWYIITHLLPLSSARPFLSLGLDRFEFALAICAIAILEGIHLLQRRRPILERLREQPAWVRWPLYGAAVFFVLMFGKFISLDFIYFQF